MYTLAYPTAAGVLVPGFRSITPGFSQSYGFTQKISVAVMNDTNPLLSYFPRASIFTETLLGEFMSFRNTKKERTTQVHFSFSTNEKVADWIDRMRGKMSRNSWLKQYMEACMYETELPVSVSHQKETIK